MNIPEALQAAALVRVAYQRTRVTDREYVLPAGYKLIGHIVGNDFAGLGAENIVPFGFIAEDDHGTLWFVARGTEGPVEWLQDARNYQKAKDPFSGQQVGQGFLDIAESLKFELPQTYSRVVGAGHSLGCPLVEIHASRNDFEAVYSFAPPNLGSEEFALWYGHRVPETYRIVVMTDLVPHLPPRVLGFENLGESIVLPGVDPRQAHYLGTYLRLLELEAAS